MLLRGIASRSTPLLRRLSTHAVERATPLAAKAKVRDEHNRFHDRRDTDFLLHEVECVQGDAADFAAILDSAETFVADWSHLDPVLDRSPPKMVAGDDGINGVVTPAESKQLVAAYREMGFAQLSELGVPFAVELCVAYTLNSAFSSNFLAHFILTRCAADLLEEHGCDALKDTYLERLRSAEWMGTMALSEPQAGSSLSTIRTLATPLADTERGPGAEYRIRGDKMWTTAGGMTCPRANARRRTHALVTRAPTTPPATFIP